MGRITQSILLLCVISLSKANRSPEIFPLVYNTCEDTPPGALAFSINATDPENDPLTYSISGTDVRFFRVETHTGRVFVERPLNAGGFTMGLNVTVSDGSNPITKGIVIILNNANVNRPLFDELSYDKDVPENTAVNENLFKVRATDADGGSITYSIDEVHPSDGFHLFSIINNTGQVRLAGRLNYTSLGTLYRLKINASDDGGRCFYNETVYRSSTVFSFITVVDVPDLDPQFIGIPYFATIRENSDMDEFVFKVTALDRDTGVNDRIIYSIEDSPVSALFKIGEDGVITVNSLIDRETVGDTVTLNVTATESKLNVHGVLASTTTEVQITITDDNDNKPLFYKCGGSCVEASQFTGEVLEHSLAIVFINMTVRDLDKNAKIDLSLDGPDKDLFFVEPQFIISQGIVQLQVKQPENLDFEKKHEAILQVVAVDQEKTTFRSTAEVTIEIIDTNDHSPQFPESTYKLNVSEHSPEGTVLAIITAEDPDTMDQGNITYRLLPESILPYFDVEPRTGKVYVKNESPLDRELRSLFIVTLQAIDSAGKPGTAVLEITVTDINDQYPVPNRGSYLVFVKEGQNFEEQIQATDADEIDTPNSQIVYSIEPSEYSDNFTIDPNTGVLRNEGELDREALDPQLDGVIVLTVNISDKGTPPLSDLVNVTINLEDINDNGPEFEAPSYSFSIKEGEKGAFVGSVFAVDKDQTSDFNRISFSIINGSFGSFIIRTYPAENLQNGYMGNITVDPDIELDYESSHTQFTLKVEAADLGQKKADLMVDVKVLDVNDERPEFIPSEVVSVEENKSDPDYVVGRFTAVDKDGNHSLIYELESMKCRCNGTEMSCNSFILEPTGEVKINPANPVDYEECDEARVEAQVVDEYTEKGANNSLKTDEMLIKIIDVNDNYPQFITSDIDSNVFVVVSESASKGTSVASVTATDQDTGAYGQIKFEVKNVTFEHTNKVTKETDLLFSAVTTQEMNIYSGLIQSTTKLDATLKGKYLVTVAATDDDGKGLSSITVLEIFTVDESFRIELRFKSPIAEVERNLDDIKRDLTAATKAKVEVVSLTTEKNDARAPGDTIMESYFVNRNGTALTSNQVEDMLSQPEYFVKLAEYGLAYIGTVGVEEPEVKVEEYIMVGMIGGLIIVLAVLTTSLVCTRRNYRRKLKAAKAMNSASMMASDNQKSGPVLPGTNKYTMEGANPVLNLNIDAAMILDIDAESSDADKVSLNSLDYSDDMIMSEKDTNPIMQRIQEEEEDERPPEYTEPLGAALAHHGQKKGSRNRYEDFSNPAFSTTDL